MLSIVIGSIVAFLGICGVWAWRWDFLTVLKGGVPACLFLGGALAIVAGVSTLKSESPTPPLSSTPPSQQKNSETAEPAKK